MQCHTAERDVRDGLIPLAGLFGREAASLAGAEYSDALKASGIVWTGETLDRYLANPGDMVPGTTMPVQVTDADERKAIVDFLRRLDTSS